MKIVSHFFLFPLFLFSFLAFKNSQASGSYQHKRSFSILLESEINGKGRPCESVAIGKYFLLTAGHCIRSNTSFFQPRGSSFTCGVQTFEIGNVDDDMALLYLNDGCHAPSYSEMKGIDSFKESHQRSFIVTHLEGKISSREVTFSDEIEGSQFSYFVSGASDIQKGTSGSPIFSENGYLLGLHLGKVEGNESKRRGSFFNDRILDDIQNIMSRIETP